MMASMTKVYKRIFAGMRLFAGSVTHIPKINNKVTDAIKDVNVLNNCFMVLTLLTTLGSKNL